METSAQIVSFPFAAQADTPFEDIAAMHAAHGARVFRFLLASLRDRHAAASLTQDTFLAAWQSRASFRGECAPSTWLLRIAVNLMHNHVRGQRYRFWSRLTRTAVDLTELEHEPVAPQANAEATLLAHEELKAVWTTVETLPEQQRTAFLLRFTEDLELAEIALAMGISASAAKTHFYRALGRVREACKPLREQHAETPERRTR